MLYIGLMSGTSMDAIDSVLVRFGNDSLSVIAYEQYPIADDVRKSVRILTMKSDIKEITRLDSLLGNLFAEAVLSIIERNGLKPKDITAIGSHGQTILHLPHADNPRTLQIGDPNIIAYETGVTTIADFRRMDMAAGGQGAPLAPSFHASHLRSNDKHRIILNIGGIANISILTPDSGADIIGFDTGPGNCLLDDWNYQHNNTPMDKDSIWARSGTVNENLLSALLNDPYFSLPPPKSTGREYFNLPWLNRYLQQENKPVAAEDVQATLVQLSARSITAAITNNAPRSEELFVCGGGVHNPLLLESLREHLSPVHIESTTGLGVDPDAVEALTFAWLAKCRMEGIPGNLPSVTGAESNVLLGAIYEAVTSNKS